MKYKAACLTLVTGLFFCYSQAQVHHAHKSGGASAAIERGKIVYSSICIACHMATGAGVPHMNPPLINTSYILGDKAKLVQIVLNGFNEDVEINGQKYSNEMTPHADLKDQQIADVLTYVRKSFGNNASTVTVADVKKARASNKK